MFRNILSLLIAGGLLSLVLFSCKDEKDTLVVDYAYEYYPLDSGHYVIYDVDSILYTYNGNHNNDTSHYQLMELITDTFYDNQNQLNYRLELYRRENSAAPWGIDRVWFIKPTNINIQKVEDDVRFIKLVFPPAASLTWNGNIYIPETEPYNDFRNWEYQYADVHNAYPVNGFNFDSTLTVSEVADTTNVIERKRRIEIYAKHVGMIYQEYEILKRQVNILGSWDATAEDGFKIRMKVIDWKK